MRSLFVAAALAASFLTDGIDAFVTSPPSLARASRSNKVSRPSGIALHAAKAKKAKKAKKVKAAAPAADADADSEPPALPKENFKKADFISSVSEKTGLSKSDSEAALAAVLDTITEEVSAGKRVGVIGFGTFKLSYRSARKGRNPQTGEELDIKASYSPSFTASKAFKEKVNEGR